ncbi:uncharacterized protein si:ch211-145b13.6 [Betta splendens]|uniref:NAD(P)(+)--arginine ADP-ribosyltransferase n=1 Tax=Betta splendens TaxID=158456 RepID=A0A6P7MFK4_BETSP|nr:uncharacterized protein si:ch211-145b13.6 [Betta splendens]XP_029005196.1 uncharacterized protein si:ch211-145b13.6 [Betta splendens]
MWSSRKLLLAAVVFSAVCCRVSAELLDESLNVDQYMRCREEALEEVVRSGLLEEEVNLSNGFSKSWRDYEGCSMRIPGGRKEHAAALAAFANNEEHVNTFNGSADNLLVNVTYKNSFAFMGLHFLLMDALVLLGSNHCKTVYLVTGKEFSLKAGSQVRFHTFNTAYQSMSSLDTDLESMTLFNISTCFFADLRDNSCVRHKNTALVSPAEQFTVVGSSARSYDDAQYTEIVLKHSGVLNFYKCPAPSRSPAGVSTQWLVSLLVALSLFFSSSDSWERLIV